MRKKSLTPYLPARTCRVQSRPNRSFSSVLFLLAALTAFALLFAGYRQTLASRWELVPVVTEAEEETDCLPEQM